MGSRNSTSENLQPLDGVMSTVENCLNLSDWMGQLPSKCLDLPLIYLAIPGSHNSMTYTITAFAKPSPDVKYLYNKVIPQCIRPWIRRWCKTQDLTVAKQLENGIRYLDLRICTKKGSEDLFYVHGLYGGEVKNELHEVARFLLAHPKEIVIIDFQHFYKMDEDDHHQLLEYIADVFGQMICPVPQKVEDVSLKYMHTNNYQVIVIYRKNLHECTVWNSRLWPTFWPETMSTKDMVDFCESAVKNRNNHCGLIAQCVLTATTTTLISLRGSVERSCAFKAFGPLIQWLNHCYKENLPVNIVIADYIHENDNLFPKAVIALNFRHQTRQPAFG